MHRVKQLRGKVCAEFATCVVGEIVTRKKRKSDKIMFRWRDLQ